MEVAGPIRKRLLQSLQEGVPLRPAPLGRETGGLASAESRQLLSGRQRA